MTKEELLSTQVATNLAAEIERLRNDIVVLQRGAMTKEERLLLVWCGIMLVRSTPLRLHEAEEIDHLLNAVRDASEKN